MLRNWIIGFVRLKSIVGYKESNMMKLRFIWLLLDWKLQHSFGGKTKLKRT
jgi:hypothetical protein